jgi:hydrogenase nickel incorporation protein HypB
MNVMILSVPEGDDKPLKYPLMFSVCDLLIINKTDAMGIFDFDLAAATERAKRLNPDITVIAASAKTGEGFDEVAEFLRGRI